MRPLFWLSAMGLVLWAIWANGCATFTTPMKDCKALCGTNKASLYESNADGEKCQCGGRDGQAI